LIPAGTGSRAFQDLIVGSQDDYDAALIASNATVEETEVVAEEATDSAS
jgi:hypothetical protein